MKKRGNVFIVLISLSILLMLSSCSLFSNGPRAPQCPSHTSLISQPVQSIG